MSFLIKIANGEQLKGTVVTNWTYWLMSLQ